MTVEKLTQIINAQNVTEKLPLDAPVTCGYTCDLLSWVMAKGEKGMAWVTVQNHMNVVAVAVLAEMACIILPEGVTMETGALEKAEEEGIPVLCSPLSAYAICAAMAKEGVPGPQSAL